MADEAVLQPPEPYRIIGQRIPRAAGRGHVTGRTRFVGDIYLPGMLYAKAKLSPYPNARIKRIDTRKAEALSGVVAVITHADVPQNRYGLAVQDQPVLADEFVRYIGEPVAAVAAVDELCAAEAVNLIEVEYEPLPAVFDALEAMQPDAPVIHIDGNIASFDARHKTKLIRMGDVAAAFAQADLIVEGNYRTQFREHTPLEPHASVAEVDASGKVIVYTCSPAPHLNQQILAGILKLPLHQVRMAGGLVGGGFGGKNDIGIDHITALLALKANRPVKWMLTRDEECLLTTKDQAYPRLFFKSAVMQDGTIIGRKVEAIQDTGAYNVFGTVGIGKLAAYCLGPYHIPNYWFDGQVVYTNKVPSATMRGFNVTDAHFAYGVHMEEIAVALGMDPLELRWKNFVRPGDPSATHTPVSDSTIRECVAAAAEVMGCTLPGEQGRGAAMPQIPPSPNPARKRGIGMCAAIHGTGFTGGGDPTMAEVEVKSDGSVICRSGATEIGAGQGTTLAMMTAEELGVPLDVVTTTLGDTEHTPYDLGTFANRITYLNGKAVRAAAGEARAILCEIAAEQLGLPAAALCVRDGIIFAPEHPDQQISVAQAAAGALKSGRPVIGRGGYLPNAWPLDPDTGAGRATEQNNYLCYMVLVEVDTRTGQIEILRSVLVSDVGQAINPLAMEGQMDGGTAFGIGMALLENMYPHYPDIQRVARGLHQYLIATTMDIHDDHTNIILEIPSTSGPFGAKPGGESTANPQAPAIINAIHNATGVWVRDLPVTPERLLQLLKEQERTSSTG
jgi:CO/xanthine dehydrogenase Mo-binding subunit